MAACQYSRRAIVDDYNTRVLELGSDLPRFPLPDLQSLWISHSTVSSHKACQNSTTCHTDLLRLQTGFDDHLGDALYAKLNNPFTSLAAASTSALAAKSAESVSPGSSLVNTVVRYLADVPGLDTLPRNSIVRQSLSLWALTYVGIILMYFSIAGASYYFIFDHRSECGRPSCRASTPADSSRLPNSDAASSVPQKSSSTGNQLFSRVVPASRNDDGAVVCWRRPRSQHAVRFDGGRTFRRRRWLEAVGLHGRRVGCVPLLHRLHNLLDSPVFAHSCPVQASAQASPPMDQYVTGCSFPPV